MTIEFHPAARDEFRAAVEFYEAAVPGLGGRFFLAVRAAADRALAHPQSGSSRGTARRLIVGGFPYDLVYEALPSVLRILAVAHQHRRPGYWRDRTHG